MVNILKYSLLSSFIVLSSYGLYQYGLAQDHSAEMRKLEKQLKQNEAMIEKKNVTYLEQQKKEAEDWQTTLSRMDNDEKELKKVVENLSVIGVGDSVMLGAIDYLYRVFPNGYFDAKISRTAWVVNHILVDLKKKGMLGEPIILNLGTNGDCPESLKIEILNTCENRKIFWVNVTNDYSVHVNEKLSKLASNHKNLSIIDWNAISKGHPEYFLPDGIHLTTLGKDIYTKTIYNAIYEAYLKDFKAQKKAILEKHKDSEQTKISFYGNAILVNAFNQIQEAFPNAKFTVEQSLNYETLIQEIENSLKENTLTHRLVFAFDNSVSFSKEQYQQLFSLCSGHEIYVLVTNEQAENHLKDISNDNIKIIDLSKTISKDENLIMADKVHLTEQGNKLLNQMLQTILKGKK